MLAGQFSLIWMQCFFFAADLVVNTAEPLGSAVMVRTRCLLTSGLLSVVRLGDQFCGAGCISNCDAVAECGPNAAPGNEECPLNVCCSKFGFVSPKNLVCISPAYLAVIPSADQQTTSAVPTALVTIAARRQFLLA